MQGWKGTVERRGMRGQGRGGKKSGMTERIRKRKKEKKLRMKQELIHIRRRRTEKR